MAEEKPETPETAETDAAEEHDAGTDAAAEVQQPAEKKARWPWIIAGVLVLALPLAWLLVPASVRAPYMKRLDAWLGRPAPHMTGEHSPTARKITPQPQPAITTTPARPLVSAADVAALRASIRALRQELAQTRHEHQAFMDTVRRHQETDLRMRLRWIVQPESRLEQLITYWEDITLLPVLSDEERARADDMLRLARELRARVHDWQTRLSAVASSLPAPIVETIRIHPDNKWLAWFTSQFRLSTSPSQERQQLEALRHRILAAGRQLAAGQWPEQAAWHALLEDIQQQLGEDAIAALPQDFKKAQDDIGAMRQAAHDWLDSLSQATERGTS